MEERFNILEERLQNIIAKQDELEEKILVLESNTFPIKIFVDENGKLPTRAHDDDYGYDIYAAWIEYQAEKDRFVVHTDLFMEIPKGYAVHIFARSSLANTDLYIPNGVAVIDSGYRGEITIVFKHRTDCTILDSLGENPYDVAAEFPFKEGDRIAQMNIVRAFDIDFEQVETIEELSKSKRGDGGYGSSGK